MRVAGVDEAGRGAWAGPLVAAAVILPCEPHQRARLTRALTRAGTFVQDSKKLTHEQRCRAYAVLCDEDVPHAVAEVTCEEIDVIGLGAANLLALQRAVTSLDPSPDFVLVDAFRLNGLHCEHRPVIHGDALSTAIALASIVAKVHRDTQMALLDRDYSHYGFQHHKGYGTASHQRALAVYGVSDVHRKSFAPVAKLLGSADRG